jgi:membrane protease YdiL (CAAX protease family)
VKNPRRLSAWLSVVAVLSAFSYIGRAEEGKPPPDLLYRWDTVIQGLVGYAVIGGVLLAIASGRFDLLALRRPRSWARSIGLAFALLVGVLIVGGILDQYLEAGEEQGYTPPEWEPSKAWQYAGNFVVIAAIAPVVEELFFRGLGYSLLEQFGRWPAIVIVGVAFAAVHGLVAGFLVLFLFGAALTWLRARTGSVLPGMLVHAAFNAIALVASVAT